MYSVSSGFMLIKNWKKYTWGLLLTLNVFLFIISLPTSYVIYLDLYVLLWWKNALIMEITIDLKIIGCVLSQASYFSTFLTHPYINMQ